MEKKLTTLEDHIIPFDLPAKELSSKVLESARRSTKTPSPRIRPIEYTEDRIRRQFFRDHPFEALRPRSLVEQGTIREEHPIQGKEWTKLSQHGRTPTPEEYVPHPFPLLVKPSSDTVTPPSEPLDSPYVSMNTIRSQ